MADDRGLPGAAPAGFPRQASWDDLRALLAVDVLGSMNKAAAALGESQPTIGRRLARLEKALGVALLARGVNAVSLTPAGRDVARAAGAMTGAAREAEAAARAARPRPDDPVRLTTTTSMAAFLSRRWTGLQEAASPRGVLILPSRRVYDLAAGEADIAIRVQGAGAQKAGPGLLSRRLGVVAFALYARRGGEDGPVIMAPPQRAMSKQLALARRLLARDPGRAQGPEIDEMHLRAEAIRAGVGVGGLPCWLGENDAGLARIEGEGLSFSEEAFLVRHQRSKGEPAIERLCAAIQRLFAGERKALAGRPG